MKRLHLIELHDLSSFPNSWRDYLTDFLSFFSYHVNPYKPAIKKLCSAMQKSKASKILDLCSGKGLYMLKLLKCMSEMNYNPEQIILTDKFPCINTFELLGTLSDGRIQYIHNSIDAINVPSDLKGFRTFFSSFHHFRPNDAKKIINDAANAKQGIAIFEYPNRNFLIAVIAGLSGPLLLLLLTPFVRPFSWNRLFWTYIFPVVPLVFCWDGFVSHLRTYTIQELNSFVSEVSDKNYSWEIAKIKSLFGFCRITYLIGFPLDLNNNNS